MTLERVRIRRYDKYLKRGHRIKLNEIIELKEKWMTQSKIAEELWCTRQNVNNLIKKYNL